MIRIATSVTAGVIFATSALADSMTTSVSLGSVLAAEELCGLTYNQDAISAFVAKNVKKNDMEFPATLQMMTAGQRVQLKDMSQSEFAAHCAQIRRIAGSYGFTIEQ